MSTTVFEFFDYAILASALVAFAASLVFSEKYVNRKQQDYKKQMKEITEEIYKISKNGVTVSVKEKITGKGFKLNRGQLVQPIDKTEIELAVHQSFMSMHQKQAIIHSRVQFYIGLVMSVLGFAFFVYVIVLSLESENNVGIAIRIVGSLIFEGISLLFLKESQKLRASSKQYHDDLYQSNNHQEAVKIASSIEDGEIKSAVQAQLALHLMGVSSDNLDVTKIIDSQKKLQ